MITLLYMRGGLWRIVYTFLFFSFLLFLVIIFFRLTFTV